jgi:hypothetical protein
MDDCGMEEFGCTRGYFGRSIFSGWRRYKRVDTYEWNMGDYSGRRRETLVLDVGWDVIGGGCLEFSHFDKLQSFDLMAGAYVSYQRYWIVLYLRDYLRFPILGVLPQMGMENLLNSVVCKPKYKRLLNRKAKDTRALFRGATGREIKVFQKRDGESLAKALIWYFKFRGHVRAEPESLLEFSYQITTLVFYEFIDRMAEKIGYRAVYDYVTKQAKRSGHAVTSVLHDWKDYVSWLDELGADNGDETPRDLMEAHDRLSLRRTMERKRGSNAGFRVRRRLYRPLVWRHGGLILRPIDSAVEIVLEGERQRNCVAGYAERHATGETAIFVLRKADAPRESWCTVEIDPKSLQWVQCRSCHNGEAPAEARAFETAWRQRILERGLWRVKKPF